MQQLTKDPLVSVLTLSRNSERTIERCLRSIQEQDYPHIQHVIQDGESTDGTLGIIAGFDNVDLVSESDLDADEAYFKGLCRCEGEIVALCWADEELLPGAVSWGVSQLMNDPSLGGVYGRMLPTDIDGNHLPPAQEETDRAEWDFLRFACWEMFPNYCGSFFRTEALRRSGFFEEYKHGRDCIMYDYYAYVGRNYGIAYHPVAVSKFSFHEGQLSSDPVALAGMLPNLESSIGKLADHFGEGATGFEQRARAGIRLAMLPNLMQYGTVAGASKILDEAMSYAPDRDFLVYTLSNHLPKLGVPEKRLSFMKPFIGKGCLSDDSVLSILSPDLDEFFARCVNNGERLLLFPGGQCTRRWLPIWIEAYPELFAGWFDDAPGQPICGFANVKGLEVEFDRVLICVDENEPLFYQHARRIFGDVPMVSRSLVSDLLASAAWQHLGGETKALEHRASMPREALLLFAYIEQYMLRIFEQNQGARVAAYGAGKHTEWLIQVLQRNDLKLDLVLDDVPIVEQIGNVPVVALDDLDGKHLDVVVVSSDSAHYKMFEKLSNCRTMSNTKVFDPYRDLPIKPVSKCPPPPAIAWQSVSLK